MYALLLSLSVPEVAFPHAPAEIELAVLFPPTPVAGAGRTHLAYELHITNFGADTVQLSKLEVLGASGRLTGLEGADLGDVLIRPGLARARDSARLGTGLRAVAILWVTLDAAAPVPTALRHRLTLGDGQVIEGEAVEVESAVATPIGPPLRGPDWLAYAGPGGLRHGQTPELLNGRVRNSARYAIDWQRDGRIAREVSEIHQYRGANEDYPAYGADVLAVADAVVTSLHDGFPDNKPGVTSSDPETTGNSLILDLGSGRFACYAHLIAGSFRVQVGDRVRRGEILARVGNSGNSFQPHLHFSMSNENSHSGEGIPYVIDSFEVRSAFDGRWRQRRNEMPMPDAAELLYVRFPD